jgi:hypothetical protein
MDRPSVKLIGDAGLKTQNRATDCSRNETFRWV